MKTNPTKIKARKMWMTPDMMRFAFVKNAAYFDGVENNPVFVLDASRYEETIEQVAEAIRKTDHERGNMKLIGALRAVRYRLARATLRSIGIVKSK